ncbi:MAG: 4Fe-4S dicluster domain-containing protein [Odoribacter sp.]
MAALTDRLKQDIHYIESMNSCMNCGVCTAICPSAEFYNYDPRIIVDTVQREDEDTLETLLKSDTIWYCGECMSCKTRCPRSNTPGGIIMALRKLSQEKGWFTESEKGRQQFALQRVVGANILNVGYCVTPDIVKPEMHPEQGPVWEWIYEHREDVYERLHSKYHRSGPGALRKIDDESLNELRNIFNVTGGSEFMKNIETHSIRKAEELGMDTESYFLHTYTDNNGRHTAK